MFVNQVRRLSSQTFGYVLQTRKIHKNVEAATRTDFKPVEIDMPWGKISGKLWGSENKQPVLALHGWMDNAGSFDKIAPLLKHSSILAIDLPGHGLSSWLPKGIPYGEDNSAYVLRFLVKKFGWKKIKLLGHSMGAIFCYDYARLFPEETQFVVSIDSLTFIRRDVIQYCKVQASAVEQFINFEEKIKNNNNPPSYPEEVAVEKWRKGAIFSIDDSSIKTLMIRGAKRHDDNTYSFTRDFRLSITGFFACYTLEHLKEMTQLITCPYFAIKASESPYYRKDKYWMQLVDIFKEKSSDFHLVEMDGSHHLHMMQAEEVANVINPFLEKYDV